jgi:hypothetical protein
MADKPRRMRIDDKGIGAVHGLIYHFLAKSVKELA